jgi:Sugar (and other) transporter
MSADSASAPAVSATWRDAAGFAAVAFAFLIVMAFATLPSPLYGLYRTRDNLSAFTITLVYAIWAAGTIAALLAVPAVASRIGRRGVMLVSVATMMASAGLLAAWKALAGLLIGRLCTGFAVGLVAGTAFTYLIELRLRQGANANLARARNIGTAINVGALGIGPFVAGCLAEWVRKPLVLPYLLWIALGALALVALTSAPETGKRIQDAQSAKRPRARVSLPAATATLAAFSANGLFAGLSGLFLATTLHNHSHALAGTTLFIVFSAGVAAQLATARLRASLVLIFGGLSMLVGLALLVTSVRLSSPSLALFMISGGLIGAGSGAVFKGTTGIVLEAAAPENRLAMTAQLLIALFIGLSIPVIGAGVALDRGASAANTVLVFAIAVALGVAASGLQLLTSEPKAANQLA